LLDIRSNGPASEKKELSLESQKGTFRCATLLYKLSSDVENLSITDGWSLQKFNPTDLASYDSAFTAHARLHAPDYVLIYDPFSSERWVRFKLFSELFQPVNLSSENQSQQLSEKLGHGAFGREIESVTNECFFDPTRDFIQALHLFKPGRLRVGETFVLARFKAAWGTLMNGRCSSQTVDYGQLEHYEGTYHFCLEDVASF